jgi:platelet-activating factor acetylhydrolase
LGWSGVDYLGYGYYLKMPWYISSPLFRLVAGNSPIWAVENAPPAPIDELPAVVFSHGLGGIRTTYSSVCSDLASHGYVVAAIEHRYIIRWDEPAEF